MNIHWQRRVELWLLPGCILLIFLICGVKILICRPDSASADCGYRVTTFAGVPYDAINDRDELLGRFERQPAGDIWLMGMDTSVQGARDCLARKGFNPDELRMIAPR